MSERISDIRNGHHHFCECDLCHPTSWLTGYKECTCFDCDQYCDFADALDYSHRCRENGHHLGCHCKLCTLHDTEYPPRDRGEKCICADCISSAEQLETKKKNVCNMLKELGSKFSEKYSETSIMKTETHKRTIEVFQNNFGDVNVTMMLKDGTSGEITCVLNMEEASAEIAKYKSEDAKTAPKLPTPIIPDPESDKDEPSIPTGTIWAGKKYRVKIVYEGHDVYTVEFYIFSGMFNSYTAQSPGRAMDSAQTFVSGISDLTWYEGLQEEALDWYCRVPRYSN